MACFVGLALQCRVSNPIIVPHSFIHASLDTQTWTLVSFVALPCRFVGVTGWGTFHIYFTSKQFKRLPSHQQLSDGFKLRLGKPFCQNIRTLFGRFHVLCHDLALRLNQRCSEKMILKGQIFVPCGHFRDIDQWQTSLIVLEDCGLDTKGMKV